MREKTFSMRLSPEEWVRFEMVAAHHELPVATLLRMLVKREEQAMRALVGCASCGSRDVPLRPVETGGPHPELLCATCAGELGAKQGKPKSPAKAKKR